MDKTEKTYKKNKMDVTHTVVDKADGQTLI